mmetsp:Transcript_17793/g.36154  ORF Transcript_17793/g.36154 Transcript_17793/m.36154 type:complete len:116 (+) Transcript_17793:27-374(+)
MLMKTIDYFFAPTCMFFFLIASIFYQRLVYLSLPVFGYSPSLQPFEPLLHAVSISTICFTYPSDDFPKRQNEGGAFSLSGQDRVSLPSRTQTENLFAHCGPNVDVSTHSKSQTNE